MFPKMMMRCWCSCCWWNESHDAQKSSQTEKSLSPPVHRYPRSLFQKRNERERDEKEIQRYLKLRLVSRSLPFSSRCGCFSCGTKKNDSNRSKSAYLGDGAVLELAGNSRELRELGGLLWREEIILNVSFASSVFAVVTRNAIDFCHSLKGLIPTWVANLPATERKKKHQRARA